MEKSHFEMGRGYVNGREVPVDLDKAEYHFTMAYTESKYYDSASAAATVLGEICLQKVRIALSSGTMTEQKMLDLKEKIYDGFGWLYKAYYLSEFQHYANCIMKTIGSAEAEFEYEPHEEDIETWRNESAELFGSIIDWKL